MGVGSVQARLVVCARMAGGGNREVPQRAFFWVPASFRVFGCVLAAVPEVVRGSTCYRGTGGLELRGRVSWRGWGMEAWSGRFDGFIPCVQVLLGAVRYLSRKPGKSSIR